MWMMYRYALADFAIILVFSIMMYVCAVYQSFTNLPCDTTKRIKFFSFARGRHDHWGQQVRAEFYNKKRH